MLAAEATRTSARHELRIPVAEPVSPWARPERTQELGRRAAEPRRLRPRPERRFRVAEPVSPWARPERTQELGMPVAEPRSGLVPVAARPGQGGGRPHRARGGAPNVGRER